MFYNELKTAMDVKCEKTVALCFENFTFASYQIFYMPQFRVNVYSVYDIKINRVQTYVNHQGDANVAPDETISTTFITKP